jgi:hypothetical protein
LGVCEGFLFPHKDSLLEKDAKKDAKKFIENDGSKRYRVSNHPYFVLNV